MGPLRGHQAAGVAGRAHKFVVDVECHAQARSLLQREAPEVEVGVGHVAIDVAGSGVGEEAAAALRGELLELLLDALAGQVAVPRPLRYGAIGRGRGAEEGLESGFLLHGCLPFCE